MKADSELGEDVRRELEWEPSVDEKLIGLTVVNGIVTLTGEVGSFGEKWNAERAAERVAGVRGVANELEVRGVEGRSDTDIAKAAADALSWDVMVPEGQVKVEVQGGWLTLRGEVQWYYQRREAERAVRNLFGVKGISNLVTVKPSVEPKDVQDRIEQAFKRAATYDAQHIKVEAIGSEVILSGNVRSWPERRAAEVAAWAAPGVI